MSHILVILLLAGLFVGGVVIDKVFKRKKEDKPYSNDKIDLDNCFD